MTKRMSHSSKGRLWVMWHCIWMWETIRRIRRPQRTATMRAMGDLELGNGMLMM